MDFDISLKRLEHDELLIRTAGELDLSTTPEFEATVKDALDLRPRFLIVDLTDLTYINSSGMYVLLKAQFRLSQEEGEVVIVGVRPEVRMTLDLIGVPLRIRCVSDMDEVHKPPPKNQSCHSQA